jgi:hypothetical protein
MELSCQQSRLDVSICPLGSGFKTGDQRFVKGVSTLPVAEVNRQARGYQFGGRYFFTAIQNAGFWSSMPELDLRISRDPGEENLLMRAKAEIRSNNIEAGLAFRIRYLRLMERVYPQP